MDNQFLIYQKRVGNAVELYRRVRDYAKVKEKGQSRTIEALARPFLNGNFTLAIIGKMSAGKSMFINALLKKRNLLATGFGQTTCTLTEICHSDDERYEVLFADGKRVRYQNLSELQKYMAIPEKYVDLPIKFINDYIVKGLSIEEIWKFRDVMKDISGKEINEELLKQYVNEHDKSNIPTKVFVYTKLPKSYQGWRVIDTPGIAAKGGIEDETYDLLNSKDETGKNNTVDAIIFINSAATQIEDRTFQEFVKEVIEKLPEMVKKRLFMVRTHGADRDYLRNQDQQKKEAHKLFVEGLKIREDRMYVVDSLSELFIHYAIDQKLDFTDISFDCPLSWEEKVWSAAVDVRDDAEKALKRGKMTVSAETIREKLEEWANFEHLTAALNHFVQVEKEHSFNEIIRLITEDFDFKKKETEKEIKQITESKGDLQALERSFDEETKKGEEMKKEMAETLAKVRKDYNRSEMKKHFSPITNKVNSLSGTIEAMSSQMKKCIQDTEDEKRTLLNKISKDFKKYINESASKKGYSKPNIDYAGISQVAYQSATYERIIGYHKKTVKKEGAWGTLQRFLSFGVYGYEEVDDLSRPIKKKDLDVSEARRIFSSRLQREYNASFDSFLKGIGEDIDKIGRTINDEFKESLENNRKRQKELMAECQNERAILAKLEELQKLVEYLNENVMNVNSLKERI